MEHKKLAYGEGRIWFDKPFDKEDKIWIRDQLKTVIEKHCSYNENNLGFIYLEQTAAFAHDDAQLIQTLNAICERYQYSYGSLQLTEARSKSETWRLIGRTTVDESGNRTTAFHRENGTMQWEDPEDPCFGTIRWCKDDIRGALLDQGIAPSEELMQQVIEECRNNPHFTDQMIEAGWDTIRYIIDNVVEEREAKSWQA